MAKLARLIKKFPETWVHTKEVQNVKGVTKTFHHVDYKSGVEGKPRVRLVSHVSADMCELLVTLKNVAPQILADANSEAPSSVKPVTRAKNPQPKRKGS